MAAQTINGKILLRNDTAANWTTENPILGKGELGIETDTGKAKVGDRTTAWNSLGYSFGIYTIAEGSTNGTISVDGTDVAVHGLGSNAYSSTSYLPLSGGTLTGQTIINRNNGSVGGGLQLTGNAQNYAISIKDTSVTKGTAPSATKYWGIDFYGVDTDNYNKRIGLIEASLNTNNTSSNSLIAYNCTTNTNTGNCRISVNVDGNGNAYTSAPTPAKASNDTNIATTAFVKTNIADYLPLSGGSMTGVINSNTNSNVDATSATRYEETLSIGKDKNGQALGSDFYSAYNVDVFHGFRTSNPNVTNGNWADIRLHVNADKKCWISVDKHSNITDNTTDNSNNIPTTAFIHSKYLSLAGGTMTGNINMGGKALNMGASSSADGRIYTISNYLRITGGNSTSIGSWIDVGSSSSSNKGITINASDGDGTTKSLIALYDGTLTWDGKDITVRSNIKDVTPTVNTTNVNSAGNYNNCYRCGCVVTLGINLQIKASVARGSTLISDLPKPSKNIGGALVSDTSTLRFYLNTSGAIITEAASPSSNTWFNGTITYLTTDD